MPTEKEAYVSTLIGFDDPSSSSSLSRTVSTSIIHLELDDTANEGETSFTEGDSVYLQVITDASSYACVTTGKSLSKTQTGIIKEVTESVTFRLSNSATLAKAPSSIVSYAWIGKNPGVNPVFDKGKITLPKAVVGILEVVYETTGDRWVLSHNDVEKVAVVAYTDSAVASLEVDFGSLSASSSSASGASIGPFNLQVKNFCDDSIIEGARVYIDGADKGLTDVNGVIYIGIIAKGSHTLKVTKTGFIDSENDSLNNDSFEV